MMNFKGRAALLASIDLPVLGRKIGVGEDEIHAFLDTESAGHGFDRQGRPTMLFEPHIFYRQLSGAQRDHAIKLGLAYPHWGERPYPADSYPRLSQAMAIDETAALNSCSWGMGQILGINHASVGYGTPQAMVEAFCDSERNQVAAIIEFLITHHLDGALRVHDWPKLAAGYNGAGYAKNGYDKKLAANFKHWQGIADTVVPSGAPVAAQAPQKIVLASVDAVASAAAVAAVKAAPVIVPAVVKAPAPEPASAPLAPEAPQITPQPQTAEPTPAAQIVVTPPVAPKTWSAFDLLAWLLAFMMPNRAASR